MLQHLHIRDFAIVPFLEQDFSPGFTAISGETGAGKSIIVDALGLLLGERSDSSWVKAGANKAELSAEFHVTSNPEAAAWLAEQELEDGGTCLLRRTIQASGRSRAWINGTPVTVQQLGELGALLVELHGQNEHIRLKEARRQLELLDETGGYQGQLKSTAAAFESWRKHQTRFAALEQAAAISAGELEFLRYQLQELQQLAIPAGQVRELEQQHSVLARAGELLEALNLSVALVDADDTGLHAGLDAAIAAMQQVRGLDPDIEAALGMLDEARINCQEASLALHAARDRVEMNPDRLAEAERRLSDLNALARKHGVSIEDLETVRDRLDERLQAAEGFEQQRESMEGEMQRTLSAYRDCAGALSGARIAHATQLSAAVEKLMGELGMAGGTFTIPVEHDAAGAPAAGGTDRVTIEVSANPGMAAGPLAKVASGGELSRISLAIKAASSGGGGRTQIFDEVDSGIGGDTANAVGRLLQNLAAGGQALCVTHLAQVAVRADQQLQVRKETGEKAPEVGTRELRIDDRVDEIARMLGGSLSEQSRAHAREMLQAASKRLH